MSATKSSKSDRPSNYLKSLIRRGVAKAGGLSLACGSIGKCAGIYRSSPREVRNAASSVI